MGDLRKKLRYLDFPHSTHEVLSYLASRVDASADGIPGLGGFGDSYVADMVQDYVYFAGRPGFQRKLNAIQELKLLEMLSVFLSALPDRHRQSAFHLLFGDANEACVTLFTKLISMSISIKSDIVLESAACLIQDHGCDSQFAVDVARMLTDEYCTLFPTALQTFIQLPIIAPLFTCNLLTALTHLYNFKDEHSIPPHSLVRIITQWVTDYPTLCAKCMQQTSTSYNIRTPVSGLLNWAINGPVVTARLGQKSGQPGLNGKPHKHSTVEDIVGVKAHISNGIPPTSIDNDDMLEFSKLLLGILQTLIQCKEKTGKCPMITLSDFDDIVEKLSSVCCKEEMKTDDEEEDATGFDEAQHYAAERLGQVVQVALSTNNLHCEKDELARTLYRLPANRLLQLILSKATVETKDAPMDLS